MSVDDYGGIFTMQKIFKDGKIISISLSAMEKLRPKWDSVPMNHRSEHIPKVPHNNSVEEEYTSKKYIKVTHYCSVHTLIL